MNDDPVAPSDAYGPIARHYDSLVGPHQLHLVDLAEEALERHAPGATAVADLGCGTGILLERFARRGLLCFGVERSRAMAATARHRLAPFGDRVHLVEADLRRFTLPGPVGMATARGHGSPESTASDVGVGGFAG